MATTQIVKRQIADGAIDNAKVQAGAAIATSKLADGADFILRDGTVAFTGNIDANSNKVINLATPTNAGDAASKSYVDGLYNTFPELFRYVGDVRATTTGNITISNPGTDSFDGVTLTSGDILAVIAQSSASENGLYTFNGSGSALTRIPQMDSWDEVPGTLFAAQEGSTNADKLYLCTSDQGGTLDTTSITFTQINAGSGLAESNFTDKEIPSGTINGANTDFTLAATPVSGSEHVYLNGLLQESGAGNDYTISTNTITFLTAPISGDKITVSYRTS